MEYLSNGLQNTQVKRICFSSFALLFEFFTKTLSKISLGNNEIGDDGIQYLIRVLQNNQVRATFHSYQCKPLPSFRTETQ
jgi:hypothetical protein